MSETSQTSSENPFKDRLEKRKRSQGKLRVLAVDDEPSILELLKTALTAFENFDVSIAGSAVDAIKLIGRQDKPFDLLLLDIQMPQMNGITLCEKLRGLKSYSETPIIMLTAMSDRKYVDQAFAAGATDYVTKPFDFLELRSRMSAAQRLVEERRRATENLEVARKLKVELDTNLQFSLDDPIAMPGLKRFLRYAEFDNYVTQLSHGRLFNSYVTAIKVLDAKRLHTATPSGEFRRGLHDVGTALSEMTKHTDDMLCYRGDGIFLCITHGKKSAIQNLDETALNRLIVTRQTQRQGKTRLQVSVGTATPMRSLSKSGALSALARAVESVETRIGEQYSQQASVATGFAENGGAPGKAHFRQKAYENVLRDLYRDEPSLRSN